MNTINFHYSFEYDPKCKTFKIAKILKTLSR